MAADAGQQEGAMKGQKTTLAQEAKSSKTASSRKKETFQFDIREHDIGLPHKVWFMPSDKPIVCASFIFMDAGAKNVNKTHPSLSEFLAPMLKQGAGPYDRQRLHELLYDSGAYIDFTVTFEHAKVGFWAPFASYRQAVDLLMAMAMKPKLPRKHFEKLRNELQIGFEESLKEAGTHLGEAWNASCYPDDHPRRVSLSQYKEDLKKIRVEDLREYLKLLSRENVAIVVLGPRDHELEIVNDLKAVLGGLPEKPKETIVKSWNAQRKEDTRDVHVEFPVPQTMLAAWMPGFDEDDPDFCTKMLVFNVVCGSSLQSLLYQEVREKRGLAYYCYGRGCTSVKDPYFKISAGTQGKSLEEFKHVIRDIFAKVCREGIPQETFQNIKKELQSGELSHLDSTGSIVGYIAGRRSDGWSIKRIQEFSTNLEKVTYQHANEVAKKMFTPEKLRFVDVGQTAQPSGQGG